MDTLELSKTLPEETRYGFPTPDLMQNLPLCPVVVRFGRHGPCPDMSCLVTRDVMVDTHKFDYDVDVFKRVNVSDRGGEWRRKAEDAGRALKSNRKPLDAFRLEFAIELDKRELRAAMSVRPSPVDPYVVFYEPITGALLFKNPAGAMAGASTCASCVAEIFEHIDTSSKHVVEIESVANGQPSRDRHKPWTRNDLKTVIVIDLAEAKRYGHRIDRGGSHASPSPHVRRGHYATLRAKRFGLNVGKRVWRKQAWVGDTEWVFDGSHYRVVGV